MAKKHNRINAQALNSVQEKLRPLPDITAEVHRLPGTAIVTIPCLKDHPVYRGALRFEPAGEAVEKGPDRPLQQQGAFRCRELQQRRVAGHRPQRRRPG
ncbi:hypothetical protein [Hydrogenophaga sp.]|uniref:hypothetical protein n=1 Tax=Hydrogenophaga sp. TaxID=1904254 RepID=UPI0027301909|nr:hypothetical protein [Hydrogenophaga sp.]MDP2073525.1 hypothetical protein [Hydrogenophaga sp.]MDP3109419.1 hypothetical protein [Hydrogenophaga sp.]